jgi:hypothetical protein
MTHIPSEDEIRQAYAALDVDHDRLRDELLSKLPDRLVTPRAPSPLHRRRWLAIAVSACVVAPLIAWFAHVGFSPHPAYALEGVHERLLKIHSLHVKGWSYQVVPDKESDDGEKTIKLPLEWYAERPSRSWHTFFGISSDAAGVRVQTSHVAADGARSMVARDSEKLFMIGETDPLATEVGVEWLLQNVWTRQLVNGPTTAYTLVGRERVDGREMLKYERLDEHSHGRTRQVVWLNPTTGLPIRGAAFDIDKTGKERPASLYEQIEIDVPPAPHMFSQEPPEGYEVVTAGKGDAAHDYDPFGMGSGSGSNKHRRDSTAIRHSFAVGNLAILVCWQHHAERIKPEDEEPGSIVPTVESVGTGTERKWELHPLIEQTVQGKVWHWSLVIPRDRRPLDATDSVQLIFSPPNGSKSSFHAFPLRFPDDKLAKILARMQESYSLNAERISPAEPLTPARLREKAAQILSQPADKPST